MFCRVKGRLALANPPFVGPILAVRPPYGLPCVRSTRREGTKDELEEILASLGCGNLGLGDIGGWRVRDEGHIGHGWLRARGAANGPRRTRGRLRALEDAGADIAQEHL